MYQNMDSYHSEDKNSGEYEYKNDEFGFTFTFLRNPIFLNDKINDKINDEINDLDKKILGEIRKNKYITIPELSK